MSVAFEAELRPGDRFESYTIEKVHAVGGISIVYAARHTFLGNRCALKTLKVQHAKDAHLKELATAEAVSLSRIRHANLVPVVNAGMTDEGIVWMEMPLLDGVTLREYIARSSLTLLETLRIARDICDGVSAAHECGISHRDLKPENTFITVDGQIIVLDLGMAKFHDFGLQSTGKSRMGGTYRYMSPEHCRGEKIDPRTDQYAIGIMMWEMAAGEYPYERDAEGEPLSPAQVVTAHIERPLPSLVDRIPGFSPMVWEIIRRATHKSREERYPSVVAMASAIRETRKLLMANDPGAGAAMSATPSPGAGRAYIPPERAQQFNTEPLMPSRRVITQLGSSSPSRPVSPHAPTELVIRTPEPVIRTPEPVIRTPEPVIRSSEPKGFEGTPSPVQSTHAPANKDASSRLWARMVVGAVTLGAVLAIGLQIALRHPTSANPSAAVYAPPSERAAAPSSEAPVEAVAPSPPPVAPAPALSTATATQDSAPIAVAPVAVAPEPSAKPTAPPPVKPAVVAPSAKPPQPKHTAPKPAEETPRF